MATGRTGTRDPSSLELMSDSILKLLDLGGGNRWGEAPKLPGDPTRCMGDAVPLFMPSELPAEPRESVLGRCRLEGDDSPSLRPLFRGDVKSGDRPVPKGIWAV